EIPEYVLFARGLHPHKGQKKRKSKEISWKNETRKYRRQQKMLPHWLIDFSKCIIIFRTVPVFLWEKKLN
ncbi:MAG: hypothetical protein SVY10_13250, partial [Thermodesulfobacteriota bacterium]|nr:hypothetical protein [Thermodesulfobacteriota bacterium]